jgi:hypothetical protein
VEESGSGRVHDAHAVLDIGDGVGALIIHTRPELLGQEIEVSLGAEGHRVHTEVLERRLAGRPAFAAIYAALPEGRYRIWGFEPNEPREVEIVGGQVAEVDWR